MISRFKKIIASRFLNQNYVGPLSSNLDGQIVVITGASRGIGRATAEILSKEGARLVMLSRNLTELKKSSAKFTPSPLILEGDISSISDVNNIIKKILSKFGRIDVLINNAGIFLDKPLEKTSVTDFESIINSNLKGVFLMSRAAIPIMKKQKEGLIINIGSKISRNTNVSPNKVLYAATKYAVEGFSFALNKELKPFGIRVTCLMPGTANTFFSLQAKDFLSPYEIASIINMLIKFKDVDFESIVFKSKRQNI